MKLTVDLEPELVADLRDRARRSGVDVGAEVAALLAVAFEAVADTGDGDDDDAEEPPFDLDEE